jgi:hypothetical protein
MARASWRRIAAVLVAVAAAAAGAADKAPAPSEQELRELRARIAKLQADLAAGGEIERRRFGGAARERARP